jgi:hypothetical protein
MASEKINQIVNATNGGKPMSKSWYLLFSLIFLATNAAAQGTCPGSGHHATCNPGQYLNYSGNQEVCTTCSGNTISNGCSNACGACPAGGTANPAHTACLVPICPASVTGAALNADSAGSGPLRLASFLGFIRNPPPPTNNGLPQFPGGTTSLMTFIDRQSCENSWTWSSSAPAKWVGTPGKAVQCQYKLASDPKTKTCVTGYRSHFVIVCIGSSCTF